MFFQAEEFSVAVQSAIGISKIPNVTRASLAALDELPAAVGVVVDADARSAFDVWQETTTEMSEFDFGEGPGPPLPGKLTPLHLDHFHHQGA